MSATVSPLTVEEFLKLPEKPGVKRELREGIVVEMEAAHSVHEIVKSNYDRAGAARVLEEGAVVNGGELLPGFRLPVVRVFEGVGNKADR